MGSALLFIVRSRLPLYSAGSGTEQSASCFVGMYVAMGSAVLFILRSRLLLYSAGSGLNRVQVVLWVCHLGCTLACVCRCDGDVIIVGHDLNWCSGWWYVCSVNVE